MGQESVVQLIVEGGRPERERHHWLLGGGGQREVVAVTNLSVMQGHGVFVSEQQNNPNRLHTDPNCNVEQYSTNNRYNIIVLWLHTNPNYNLLQDSIKNT